MKNTEWEVNELFPVSDSLEMITVGTVYKDAVIGIAPLIAIDVRFGIPQVADCLHRQSLNEKPKVLVPMLRIGGYEFNISPDDKTSLIIVTPKGGCYSIRKIPDSETKIAWTQIREKADPDNGQEDQPPSRLDLN